MRSSRLPRIGLLLPALLGLAACSQSGDGGAPGTSPDAGPGSPVVDGGAGETGDATVAPPNKDAGGGGHDAQSAIDSGQGGGDDGGSMDAGGSSDAGAPDANQPDTGPAPFDVTFIVMADSHADPVPEDDLLSQVRAINNVSKGGVWPAQINGSATGFLGGPIADPRGVVICGDLTGWGTAPTEIPMFRSYFEQGNSSSSINYPAYIGFGNHDIDTADRDQATADAYRAQYWSYLGSRYGGPSPAIPVTSYDDASGNYSWDWGRVHLVMTHRFVGDTGYGHPSGLPFLADDLKKHASDGRPVFVFHHYGMDAFGTNGQWWTPADRSAYRAELTGYGITAIFTGHTHYAMQYSWEGLRVFQANNAKAEIDAGNDDGNGSFAIVRITDQQLDVVTARWTDDQGHYELIEPYFSGPSDVGLAP